MSTCVITYLPSSILVVLLQVALHVIKQHRYRPPGEDGRGAPVQETIHDRALQDDVQQGGPAAEIFMKQVGWRLVGKGCWLVVGWTHLSRGRVVLLSPLMVHQGSLYTYLLTLILQDARLVSGGPSEALTSDFLRKYIIFARRRYAKEGVRIDIQDEAAEKIVEYYGSLRRKSHQER